MLDPFPIQAPKPLQQALTRISDTLSVPTLALHGHEVIFALAVYIFICNVVSPALSRAMIPKRYAAFNKRTRINWDVHVVSFCQSCIICGLSLWVIFADEERKEWRQTDQWDKRIWGYTGATGLCQSFALGYFLWDLYMCTRYIGIFGAGMLAHAVSAVTVFAFGFRPFLYFWAPVFLLYELSSPFLNIHWFCDKLDLTGSTVQAVNGAFLIATFFGCRLIWGTYSSIAVFTDVFKAINAGYTEPKLFDQLTSYARAGDITDEQGQVTAFMGVRHLPLWLGSAYLASNLVLNMLNWFWFTKMIQTIRTRFEPPWGTKGVGPDKIEWEPRQKSEKDEAVISRSAYEDGHTGVEVTGTQKRAVRSRRKA